MRLLDLVEEQDAVRATLWAARRRRGGGIGRVGRLETFRVVVGPVDAAAFAALAPDSARMRELVELVRLYMDPGLDFDVQVILRKEDVPETQLGETPAKLGWNAWLRQLPPERDADQSIHDPMRGVL